MPLPIGSPTLLRDERDHRDLYLTIFNRIPSRLEISHLERTTVEWPGLIRAMLASNEFMYVD